MKHFTKRSLSLFLSFAILFQSVIYFPAKAASSAEGSGTVALGGSAIAYSQKLTDNGNGTYTLSLTLKDASHVSDVSMDDTVSRNNYFTASANGDYLFELWGGTGGNGTNSSDANGGSGGASGHVYGIITLNKGETLYYQLGGNGNTTVQTDAGGGVNGDGGASGDSASYGVGGGGGYSAIYKFAPGEFERALTEDHEIIFTVPYQKMDEFMKGMQHMDGRNMTVRSYQHMMQPDYGRPPFYNTLFEYWGQQTGPVWDK